MIFRCFFIVLTPKYTNVPNEITGMATVVTTAPTPISGSKARKRKFLAIENPTVPPKEKISPTELPKLKTISIPDLFNYF
jgi:hypothetical protein